MSEKEAKPTAKKTVKKAAKTTKKAATKSTKKNKEVTEEVVQTTPEAVSETPIEEVTEDVVQTTLKDASETAVEEVKSEEIETKIEEPKAKSEDFDWSTVLGEESEKDVNKEEESLYSLTMPKIEEKQVLDGKIVSISEREVIVDINFKSDGVISSSEFKYNEDLKIGDEVEILVEKQEDKNGQLILSHRRARVLRAWEKVNIALETGEVVHGKIKSRTKGGMIAEVFGIEAFLPGSQIDVKPIRDYDEYVGRDMEFKVVKVNEAYRNVVVSHKALIEADLEGQKAEIMSKLEKGQVIEGVVKNITSYGVFVDLGGVDGLIHITDLSWGRVSHPEEVVKLDETINVVILEFDKEKKRIQLGLKQLGEHPWDSLDEKIKEGDTVKGKVVVVADYGVFVEIQTGVEALVHVSEMSWSTHLKSAGDFYKVGDEIEAKILTLDREERKMSLGVKQLTEDPWVIIDKKYSVGSRHAVKVRNFTNFGIFVELEEGIDGLVHISDLSWTKKIKHPAEFTKVGESIDVIVLEIDVDNRRISLGHKQTEVDPWDNYETTYIVGNHFDGTVTEIFAKGAIINLGDDDVEAFSPLRYLEKEDDSKLTVGESSTFRVLEFSKENRRILVSHTSTFKDEEIKNKKKEKSTTAKVVKKIQETQQKSTLGDLDSLSSLKDNLEEQGE
ncbi:MAG: 30S ribosomal protein S1 [Flavobacteriales bacterium]|mgnify:FL=1|nr:30S ribosomal protein S1 [Flavobacteriales bacterium]MBT5699649.1 30S ribosomal protein S1 [Flavobacteriales bacterium]